MVNNPLILISACLMGQAVRYDGDSKLANHPILFNWSKLGLLIPVCPEVEGGLPIPRCPAEISSRSNGTISVINTDNQDVTNQFDNGADYALRLCVDKSIKMAILTESSPSCGSSNIYDGSFSSIKIDGEGVTTKLLRRNNIKVFSEHQLDEALNFHDELKITRE
ncbi:MAG: hypothetical protein COA86_11665 [Kangiella sp.]|nr:MAG: hypothetical protein COA86_11665 [Kangiella sp.]